MEDSYTYPLDIEWTQAEMLKVMEMWQAVEQYYEKGLVGEDFLQVHRDFKTVIKSIGEERRLGRDFEDVSGYSLYQCVKTAKDNPTKLIKMKEA